jgi:hypothetical protein
MKPPSTNMSPRQIFIATLLLFSAKFFYWILSRGIYPFADEFSVRMNVSRATFFNALSVGELAGVVAIFFGACLRGSPIPSCRCNPAFCHLLRTC